MGLGRLTNDSIIHTDLYRPNNKLVNAQLEHFGAQTNRGQTWTHKIQHGPDKGKPSASPLQYTLCLATGPAPKCHFVPGLPSGSPEIPKIGTFASLKAHNFVCKPPIEARYEAKLQPFSRAFQQYVTRHLHGRESGQFLIFSGRESNCQFDSQPFFWP